MSRRTAVNLKDVVGNKPSYAKGRIRLVLSCGHEIVVRVSQHNYKRHVCPTCQASREQLQQAMERNET